jgi:hypothetical protein
MNDDDRLRRLLSDAASEIEPRDRLHEIRASVHPDPQVVPMSRPRPWLYALSGAVASAAVIGVIAFTTHALSGPDGDGLGAAGGSGQTGSAATALSTATATDSDALPTPSESSATPDTTPVGHLTAVYYVGDGPHGAVLLREFATAPPGVSPLDAAVQGLMTDPVDGDYRTSWAAGSLVSARLHDGVIEVTVGSEATPGRPAALSPREATETIQQAVYTLQAAVQSRAKVQFLRNGRPAARVFGVDTSRPLAQGRVLTTLSLVNISDPADGSVVSRGRLVVNGVNNSFEGNVVLRVERDGHVVRQKPGIGGFGPGRLYPWRITLDTTSLAPGDYTLVASTDDPSGRSQSYTDSKVIHLK